MARNPSPDPNPNPNPDPDSNPNPTPNPNPNPNPDPNQRLGWEPGTGLGAQQQGALLPAASLLTGQLDKKGLSRADEVPAASAGDKQSLSFSASLAAPVPFVSLSNTASTAGGATESSHLP